MCFRVDIRRKRNGLRKMDGSFTTGPVVATVLDCIRVTMVLSDIFGLASSQRTWLNLHTFIQTHTHAVRETQRCNRPLLREYSFQPDLKLSVEDLLPLSTYFLGICLNFPWHSALLFTLIAGVS